MPATEKPLPDIQSIAAPDMTAARAGAGRDLVVLHSLLTDRHAFDPVLADLSARFRVTLLNLPGFHGAKPVAASLDAYAAWLSKAFDAFQIGRDAILMGNGFGGTVALAFALAHGDRLAKLVLCDVAPGFPEPGKEAFRVMAKKVAEAGMGTIAEIAANRVFHAAYLTAHPQAIGERKAVLLKIDPAAFRAACTSLIDADLVPKLAGLKVPTLVVYGELDQATPPGLNKLIALRAPGVHAIELAGCGHCPPLEQPRAFLAAISDFLAT
ncbi:MAG TPA: alpha/beta fold hydrolase [Xanthobacteraceae bacterium]|nr:alpha/beta fold hydrolase [Xanthobacteraceae bacterium]